MFFRSHTWNFGSNFRNYEHEGMDGTCLSQAKCGWTLSQLACTSSSCQDPSHPTCQPRAGFSVGRDNVFDVKSGCLRFRTSCKKSQFLGDEMFSKGQTEALGVLFRSPSVCACIPQNKKPSPWSPHAEPSVLWNAYGTQIRHPSRKSGDY